MTKNDQLGQLGSPLAANRERGVVYNDTARAGDVNIPLADQRPGLIGTPQGTRGHDYNIFITKSKLYRLKWFYDRITLPGLKRPVIILSASAGSYNANRSGEPVRYTKKRLLRNPRNEVSSTPPRVAFRFS